MAQSKVTKVTVDTEAARALLKGDVAQEDLEDSADAVLAAQKRAVPVDTRNLQKHLEKRRTPDGLGWQVGAWEHVEGQPDQDYAQAVEFGHTTKAGTFVPAQPYIRPSLDAAKKRK